MFQGVAGVLNAVFPREDGCRSFGAGRVAGVFKQSCDDPSDAGRLVPAALNGARDLEPAHAAGVVRLVVGVGHDEHGSARAEALGGGSDSALVDYGGGAGEERGEGRVLGDADGAGELLLGAVAGIGADEQDCADAQAHGGLCGDLVEGSCGEDCRGTEGEDDGGLAGVEKFLEVRRQAGVAGVGVVEAEAGDEGVGGPVFLLDAEGAGEEGEDEVGGVLGVEDGIGACWQAELAAQIVDGLGPLAGDKAGEAAHGTAHGGKLVCAGEAGIGGKDRGIEGGEEGEGGKDVAGPGDSGGFGDDGAGVVELAEEEEVGAYGLGGGLEEIVVGVAEDRVEEVAEASFSALFYVVDHLDEDGVVGVDVGADGMELDTKGLDPGPVDGGEGHDGSVAAAFELEGDGNERIDIAEGADVR